MVIVFDIGGVLLDLDYDRAVKTFKTVAGFERIEEFLDKCHQRGIIHELEAGQISAEEFVEKARPYCKPGVTREMLEQCFRAFIGEMHPEKVRIIRDLYAKYDLYLLSNNNPLSMKACCDKITEAGLPVEKYFKKAFVSSEMKMMKPSAEFFNAAIADIGCPPSEILFLDDSQRNVDGALSVGINAKYCGGIDDFLAIFAGLI